MQAATEKATLPHPVHVAAEPGEGSDGDDECAEPRHQPSTVAEIVGVREAEGFFTVHFRSFSCPKNVFEDSMEKDPDNHLHSDPSAHECKSS
jgi:hypothetical protein